MEAESQTETLLVHWRNEAIVLGKIVDAIMGHLVLTQEEKFYLSIVEGRNNALMEEKGSFDVNTPKEILALIESGDDVELRKKLNEASPMLEDAVCKYYHYKQEIKHQAARSSAV